MCDLPISSLAADRCHLYLWATCPLLPDALKVMEAWGFKYATIVFVWVKMNKARWENEQQDFMNFSPNLPIEEFLHYLTWFGPGYYTGSNIELVLLGRKGKPFRHAKGRKARQIIYAPHGDYHSQIPEEMQMRIEWMYPDVEPRLELFARRPLNNWTAFGDEV